MAKKRSGSRPRTSSSKSTLKFEIPIRAQHIPVTQVMLFEVRDELKSEVRSMHGRFDKIEGEMQAINGKFDEINGKFGEINGTFKAIDARFEAIDARFEAIDGKFKAIDGRFDQLDGKFTAEFHKLALLIEEQNARNRFVLDGLGALFDIGDRVRRLENER